MALVLSPSWLAQLLDKPFSADDLVAPLSCQGFETEIVKATCAGIQNVVTGEVLETSQHPNADRLKVCRVDVNQAEPLTIVCGCPSVAPGMIVPVALDGAVLPEMTIKAAPLRGIDSQGMLCTALELGLTKEKAPLLKLAPDTPIGEPIQSVLPIDEAWYEVEITPNRGDAISVLGIARELGILLNETPHLPVREPLAMADNHPGLGDIDTACLSYAFAHFKCKAKVDARLPINLAYALHVSGLNRVNNMVDILNYVMLYLGQPMHAFDADQLKGDVCVRFAFPDESLALLDGKTIKLHHDDLVIADDSGPIALAGIMGGEATKVTENTQAIFLESASFDATVLAKSMQRHGVNTDASYRYVRGTDPEITQKALEEAIHWLKSCYELTWVSGGVINQVPERNLIRIGVDDVNDYLGQMFSLAELRDYMEAIGAKIVIDETTFITIKPPSYRNDIHHRYDLIEEVARLYGYDRLPRHELTFKPLDTVDPFITTQLKIAQYLVARGYQELYAVSLQSKTQAMAFAEESSLVSVDNPLSEEFAVLRPQVIASLHQQVISALKHFNKSGQVFELGYRFKQPHQQQYALSMVIYGEPNTLYHQKPSLEKIKGDIASLLSHLRPQVKVHYVPIHTTDLPCPHGWHPNQTAQVFADDEYIGVVGLLHPSLQQDCHVPLFAAELAVDAMMAMPVAVSQPQKQSKFPPSTRDLSFWVGENEYAGLLRSKLLGVSPLIQSVEIMDDYVCNESNQRSLAFRLRFQSYTRTLTDEEIDSVIQDALKLLTNNDVKLRDH